MSSEIPHAALAVRDLKYSYDGQQALAGLNLTVQSGHVFALLGPNGSGKTTLFRLISTLAPIQEGHIEIFGQSLREDRALVRAMLGIVFQSPSLDPKLTVAENIRCQAALYGLRGQTLKERQSQVVEQLGIGNRLSTPAEQLSGGLKRRVELAKGILHKPKLLLMDEPSTGLDPASRLDLWHAIKDLQRESGVTILLTTHLLDEADKADQIAIIDDGRTVAEGPPSSLRRALGNQVLSLRGEALAPVQRWLEDRKIETQRVGGDQLRVHGPQVAELIPSLSQQFDEQIQTLTLGQPSLEDVFVARTGHRFWDREATSDEKQVAPDAKTRDK